jgi:hypothetical protein
MLLAGSAGDQVRLLEPPVGSAVGDAIYLEVCFSVFIQVPSLMIRED